MYCRLPKARGASLSDRCLQMAYLRPVLRERYLLIAVVFVIAE